MEIREAKVNEIDDILKFIKNNWKSNHIYVLDKQLFKYDVLDKNKVNFILGIEEGEIKATLGYIKYSEIKSDIFTIVWKNIGSSLLGLKCLEFLVSTNKGSVSSCGINFKTKKIYDYLGFSTGKLEHYYILNVDLEEYKIAKIISKNSCNLNNIKLEDISKDIFKISTEEEFRSNITQEILNYQNIYKSPSYLIKRYLNHPYYNYKLFFYKESLIVVKVVEKNRRKCLRVIDFIGNDKFLPELTSWLIEKMKKLEYEYIDFYQIGISEDLMNKAGFTKLNSEENNIIPNYFEPFEQKNIDIYYMTSLKKSFKIFKGDGDQDRPSIIKKEKSDISCDKI